jgi:hypothetical protein
VVIVVFESLLDLATKRSPTTFEAVAHNQPDYIRDNRGILRRQTPEGGFQVL